MTSKRADYDLGVRETVNVGADAMSDLAPEAHLRYFATFVGTLLAGFGRYLEADDVDLTADGADVNRHPCGSPTRSSPS